MNGLKNFLTSPSFGFVLKFVAAIAAAGFGIFGVGAKTREDNGQLNAKGRIAIYGIILAAILAVGTGIYDFNTGEEKARKEQQQTHQLLLSVRRGIYPLHGVQMSFRISIENTGLAPLHEYRELLSRTLPHDDCLKQRKFHCAGPVEYEIRRTDPLFPASGSAVAAILRNIIVEVRMYKLSEADAPPHYISVGQFVAYWPDAMPDKISIIYSDQIKTFAVNFDDIQVSDKITGDSSIGSAYSLADFMPGLIAAEVSLGNNGLCKALGIPSDTCERDQLIPEIQHTDLISMILNLPYPKRINFSEYDGIRCDNQKRHFLVLPLADVDSTNWFSGIPLKERKPKDIAEACEPFKDADY